MDEEKTVLMWDGDDSEDAYEFLKDRIREAFFIGGRVMRLDTYGVTLLGDPSQVSSGRFMYVEGE